MPFKLLSLPETARQLVFGCLVPMELLELSLCSKKANSMIMSSRSTRCFKLKITKDYGKLDISVIYRDAYSEMAGFKIAQRCPLLEPMILDERRTFNGVEYELRKSFDCFEMEVHDRFATASHIVDFIFSLFNPKILKITICDASRLLPQVLDWHRDFDHVELFWVDIRVGVMNEMLEKWFGTRRKRFEWFAWVNPFEQLIELPKFEYLYLCHQYWLTPQNFSTLDAKTIRIVACNVTTEMLILFVQKWVDGAENFSVFRYMEVKASRDYAEFNCQEFISTFRNQFVVHKRNVRRPQFFDPILLRMVDVNEGRDIRSNGKLATVILKPDWFYFYVWDSNSIFL